MATEAPSRLRRDLGLGDAVAIGLASMIGAGAFVAIPAADGVSRPWLLWALGVAAFVALCNALSSAQLAAVHPESGGTYAYARHRLGTVWSVTAGWAFVAGKVASCAAIARTIALYALPDDTPAVVTGVTAAGVAAALAGVDYRGVRRTAHATRVFAVVGLVALLVVVSNGLHVPVPLTEVTDRTGWEQARAIFGGAAILFFAFAGYARIATLGEEVREPARTIPRAIVLSVALVAVLYGLVAATWLTFPRSNLMIALDFDAPLEALVQHSGRWPSTAWIVRMGAVTAGLGVLLSLMAGIARTLFAAAHNGDAPRRLGAVHPRHGVPHVATVAVGTVVAVLAAVADVRDAIAFSAFTVLVYYAITNASALRLHADERRWPPAVAWLGLAGCVALASTLPARAVVPGAAVIGVGVVAGLIRRRALSPG